MTREEMYEALAKTPFYEQVAIARKINEQCGVSSIRYKMSHLECYGCFLHNDEKCIWKDVGDYHVYIWKHAWGEPFYVGSGKGFRWKQISSNTRCNEFYAHIDRADSVVYKILDGVDVHTARKYEKYISAVLSISGCDLANGDNVFSSKGLKKQEELKEFCDAIDGEELTQQVKKNLMEILNDSHFACDYRATSAFINQYGNDYFSRNSCRA